MSTARQALRNYYNNHAMNKKKSLTRYHKNRVKYRKAQNLFRLNQKISVLTHYGKNRKLQCCWFGCLETDLDVLTLDHVEDNGAKHRRGLGYRKAHIYGWIISNNYPKGFQTLCWNHQWKKEMTRRREDASF